MQDQSIKFIGRVAIKVIRAGEVIQEYHGKNLVVDGGKDYIFGRLVNNAFAPDYDEDLVSLAPTSLMRLGSGLTPPRVSDVDLESLLADVAFSAIPTLMPSSGVVTGEWVFSLNYQGLFPAHGGVNPVSITEAGLYVPVANSATPRLIARIVFPQISKSPIDTVEVNWTLSMA